MIIYPGPVPQTSLWKELMSESGHEVQLSKGDFHYIYKKGAPIVIAHSGSNHFIPTIIMNAPEAQQWLLDIIATLGKCMLDICKNIDTNYITDTALVQLEVLKKAMTDSISVFVGAAPTPVAGTRAKSHRGRRRGGDKEGLVPYSSKHLGLVCLCLLLSLDLLMSFFL